MTPQAKVWPNTAALLSFCELVNATAISQDVNRLILVPTETDTRKDFLHKLSTKVVTENQAIVLEDLNVSGMVKNRRLARVISLQGWREFRVFCEVKSEKLSRDFRVINRWEPTSQTCSCCGYRWGKIDLSVRSVLCLNCNTEHDRDDNASKNIEMVGMGHRHDLKRTGSNRKTASVASCFEPSRITALQGQ